MQQLFEQILNYWLNERVIKNPKLPKLIKFLIWGVISIPVTALLIWGTFAIPENTTQRLLFGSVSLVMVYATCYLFYYIGKNC